MSVSNRISDGVFFHAVIQGQSITVQLPPEITPALSGLPAASATFTGRDDHIAELLGLLVPGPDRQQAVLVAAVAGLAGVGKTELAVQTAVRALAEDGWFPGGVLFVDMFGYDAERLLSPDRALDGLLHALGLPGEHIPPTLQDRSRLYRSVLAAYAAQGRRVLVVIDNASAAHQVRPLLPTDGSTAALVTSRHTLDIEARLHDLNVLDEAASVDLLGQALRQARGAADTRVRDEPAEAAAIARLCGGLPLALRVAAALLADTPTRPLASLAEALRAAHTRLDRLHREDRAVRAAFDLSYRHLPASHARLFRLLPLNAGPDIATESAARLADLDSPTTETLLSDLARAHLIEPAAVWGRWRAHDLVRLYADERGVEHAVADDRHAAQSRLHAHYITTTADATEHLLSSSVAPPTRFPGWTAAMAWLRSEHSNLIATTTAVPPLGSPATSTALAMCLPDYLERTRSYGDMATVSAAAVAIARSQGDLQAEGHALNNHGYALREMRRFDDSIAAHARALDIATELDDRLAAGVALQNLGNAFRMVRRFEESVAAHRRALALVREFRDRNGEGSVLNSLGLVLGEMRRFDEAVETLGQAVAVVRELEDQRSTALGLTNLGTVLTALQRYDEAVEVHGEAAAIAVQLEDRHFEGGALGNMGNALTKLGRDDEAFEAHTRAVAVFREQGDRHAEGQALSNLGLVLVRLERLREAADAHALAVAIAAETGDRQGEGAALNNLGEALVETQALDEAVVTYTRAVEVFREVADSYNEAGALSNLGWVHFKMRRLDEAVELFGQAAVVFARAGEQGEERKALRNQARAHNERWLLRWDEYAEPLV
ncbi:tetratricopeptide repeat-containing protein [Streptomyces venezuelae]|uniref:Tetratricopeptide repeat-containing protein n=1 Tax=Streptomyces venezuelae TaxID=54571 RepID=A0A5P2D3Z6_STRVZ|nr:tetratricopeptide repeat protein [Streptomyces venezuelae]QES48758.1 tetratricopeptide repeat-containing protein [Streptomyces venezuelae]